MAQAVQEDPEDKKNNDDKEIQNNVVYKDTQYFATCLRVKYPVQTVDFLVKNFGMILLYQTNIKDKGLTYYFLISSKANTKYPASSSKEAEELLWSYKGGVIQLKYHDGDDKNDKFIINNGNVEPHRGFGHIAFNTNDVFAACSKLEENGVTFKKKPNEGRMKGLAFAYDPNGYWIEIVTRQNFKYDEEYNLSQTMLRIKNPKNSLPFYRDTLGMKMIQEMNFENAKFSLFFLSSFVNDVDIDKMDDSQRKDLLKKQWDPVIELTHNWGTEKDDKFEYHNGIKPCDLGVGFQSITFLVKDLAENVSIIDPDGYQVELIQKGKNPFLG